MIPPVHAEGTIVHGESAETRSPVDFRRIDRKDFAMGRTMDLLTPVSREARRILGPGRPEIIKATDDFPEPGYRVSLEF